MDLQICLIGKGNSLVYAIDYVIKKYGVKNLLVVPSKSDPESDSWQFSIKKYCEKLHVKICDLEAIYSIEKIIIISIQYDRILNPTFFKTKKIFNIHFSLLPSYKGVYPAIWPILNNEKYTGVTLHKIDYGIDTGDIIDNQKIKIDYNDSARDLYYKCINASFTLFKRNINKLLRDNYFAKKQDYLDSTYYSKKSIDFNNLNINLNKTACQIHNQLRAFIFREFQLPVVYEKKINKSIILDVRSFIKSGTIIEQNDEFTIISTVDYNMKLIHDFYDQFFKLCEKGKVEELYNIIKYIYDLEITNNKGWTGLMIAAFNENLPVVEFLLKLGAKVNAQTYKGTTPLMYAKTAASFSRRLDVLDCLIKNGAVIDIKDFYGVKLMEYAYSEGCDTVIDFLNNAMSND